MSDKDPSEVIDGILSSGRNIRFGRGVVSKTSYVAAIAVVVWVVVAWRWSDNLASDAGLFLVGILATAFAGWFVSGTHRFAEKNPAQALLEGAELLEWQKTEMQAKGLPPIPPTLTVGATTLAIEKPEGERS